jgi:hypothetical protein
MHKTNLSSPKTMNNITATDSAQRMTPTFETAHSAMSWTSPYIDMHAFGYIMRLLGTWISIHPTSAVLWPFTITSFFVHFKA